MALCLQFRAIVCGSHEDANIGANNSSSISLDGGKMPGMTPEISLRKIKSLINHPERNSVDLRLLSQVELNIIRSNAYGKLNTICNRDLLPPDETRLRAVIDDTTVELSLWHNDWANLVSTDPVPHQRSIAVQNLHIQHQWALMTLHLKVIAATGIENIAIMTEFQQDSVLEQKKLQHCICSTSSSKTRMRPPTSTHSAGRSTTFGLSALSRYSSFFVSQSSCATRFQPL